MILRAAVSVWLSCIVAWGQQSTLTWQQDVRKYAEAEDWVAAMNIVEREVTRAPQDMDVRAWRAKVLMWSGKLAEAEVEYHEILTAVPNDPDDWMGLASVYSREGRSQDALQALDRAVALDPKRADLRVARASALRTLGAQRDAKMEFSRAVDLDPTNVEGRRGLLSLRGEPSQELRVGVNTDLFNFADANQDEGINLFLTGPHAGAPASPQTVTTGEGRTRRSLWPA